MLVPPIDQHHNFRVPFPPAFTFVVPPQLLLHQLQRLHRPLEMLHVRQVAVPVQGDVNINAVLVASFPARQIVCLTHLIHLICLLPVFAPFHLIFMLNLTRGREQSMDLEVHFSQQLFEFCHN